MTGFLVRWSVVFRLLVLALAAGIVALGFAAVPRMPIDALPEFNPAHVEIQTEALGLSAVEVEQLITSPLEVDILNGVAYLDEIRSESIPGLSSIELVFERGTDLLRARQLVAERLTRASVLPNVSTPPVLMQPLSSTGRVMMVKLSSTEVPLIDMSVLARWNIKPRLMGVPGVANVSIWGQREQQMQVHVDPEVLQARGVTLGQVIESTGNAVWVSPLSFLEASTPGTGGFIETANQRLGIQHVLPITTPSDLAGVSIEDVNGPPLVLGDVSTVVEDHQPLIGDAVVEEDPGLILVIEKFPESNTLAVTAALEEALDDLGPGLSGIEVDRTVYRPASFIESAAQSLGIALLVAVLLAGALLGFYFRSWRLAVLGLAALTVTTAATVLVLFAFGGVLNVMVFAGFLLATTVIVGDVVADLYGLHTARATERGQREQRDASPERADAGAGLIAPASAADLSAADATVADRTAADSAAFDLAAFGPRSVSIADSLQRTRTPVAFSTLVMALAVGPALFLTGVDGALLFPLMVSYLVTLGTAMVVAWTVTPALAVVLLSRPPRPAENPALGRASSRYRAALSSASGHSKAILAGAAVVALAGAIAVPVLAAGQRTIPVLRDRTLLIQLEAIAGTSIQEMGRITAKASREVGGLPGVANVGGHVGRALTSDQVVGVSSAELWVTVADDADPESVASRVQDVVDGYPGLQSDLVSYGADRVSTERARSTDDLVVRVYGVHQGELRETAENVLDVVAATDGVVEPRLSGSINQPIAEIEVDLAAAQKAAIKPGDVRRAAAVLLQGIEVGFLFEKQKVFQVLVTGVPETRNSLSSVADLLVDTPAGGHVRLGDIADVRVVPHQTAISHVDTSRYIDVVAELDGRSRGDVEADVRAALAEVDFPVEYHAEVASGLGDQPGVPALVWGLLAGALVLILVLLQTATGSWRVAAIVFVSLSLAVAGGVAGALLGGGVQSLATFLAFVAVLGIATRDSVLLIRRAQTLDPQSDATGLPDRRAGIERTEQHSGARGRTVVLDAARDRFVPTLASSGLTAVVVIPFAVWGGVVGSELILPMAMVLWGGLLGSALLTMFVLPALLSTVGVHVRDEQLQPGSDLRVG